MSTSTAVVMMLAVLTGLLGLAVGSFLNVVIYRVPAGESVVRPGSHCPNCGAQLRPWHNIPVISWLALRGRCAFCSAPIPSRYPIVETATATLFVALALRIEPSLLPAYLFLGALGIALAVIDIDCHRLPNRLVLPAYPVLGALLLTASTISGDWSALLRASIAAAATFTMFYTIAAVQPGGMGYGDVKLAGLLGGALAYLSWSALFVGLFSAFLFGALAGIMLMVIGRAERKTAVAFGPFLLVGAAFAIFAGSATGQLYMHLTQA